MQHVTDVVVAFSASKIWMYSVPSRSARSGALSLRFLPPVSIDGQAKIRSCMLVVLGLLTAPRVLRLPHEATSTCRLYGRIHGEPLEQVKHKCSNTDVDGAGKVSAHMDTGGVVTK
uniref:Predicted protein n=1 Tax=Hordeum vulgare subsp. vulgare TaxID=112509 RepID=F2E036_HORVV|nr:predicted protein [Hordeum vulgare subsp. vulgare]